MLKGKRYQADKCDITVTVVLNNPDNLKEKKTAGAKHCCFLLIGTSFDVILSWVVVQKYVMTLSYFCQNQDCS